MSLGTLTIDIAANVARLQSDVGRGVQIAERGMKQIESAATIAKNALGLIGVGIAADGVRDFIAHSIHLADELGKVSAASGVSVESLSALRFVAQQSDTDFGALSDGLRKLRIAQSGANTGNAEMLQMFKDIGVSQRDLRDLKPEELFLKVAQGVSELGTESERTTALTKLMGKSADDLGQIATMGAAGIRQMMAEAKQFGAVMDGETARAAKVATDNIDALNASAESLSITLLSEMAPHLESITNAMREAAKDGGVLKSIWIGLGGAAAYALGFDPTELERTNKEIDGLTEKIRVMRLQVESGSTDPDGSHSWLTSVLMPDIKLNEQALAHGKETLAQYEAQLKSLQEQRKKLVYGDEEKEAPKVDKPLRVLSNTKTISEAEQAEKQRLERIKNIVVALQREAATTGESTSQIKLYELAQLKATDADLERAKSAQVAIDAFIAQQEVYANQIELMDRATQLRTESLEPEVRAIEDLKEKYRDLDAAVAAHVISKAEADKTKGGLSDNAFSDITDYLKTDEERLQDSYDRRRDMLEAAHEDELVGEEKYQKLKAKLADKYSKDQAKLESQRKLLVLQNAADLFDGLAGIAQAAAGKQSAIYKTLFAISKAFAIAESLVKIQTGIAEAAANPWPTNLVAMGSVIAATGSIVSTIRGTNMEGVAHGGMSNIPREGSWLLNGGERVLAPQQNKDLTEFLRNGGGAPSVTLIEDASRSGEVSSNGRDIAVYVAKIRAQVADDIMRGGSQIARAMESTYGVNRGMGARR